MTLPTLDELASRRAQMFPELTPAQVARVAACGVEQDFSPGEIVWEQGDAPPMYVVLEGELEVVHPRCGVEEPVTVHHAREFTGEMNALAEGSSMVRGRARGRLRTLRVENRRLRTLIQTDSEISELMMRAYILRRLGLLAAGQGDAIVIGSRHSADTVRLQTFLAQSAHPFRYVDVERDPDVQALLDHFRIDINDIPIVICREDKVLRNPSNAEVAECLGFTAPLVTTVVHDVIVCGAGPGGLAAAVYGASEGLDVLVLEAGAAGGQAASSSKIENYLGFPTGVSGAALAGRAISQAEKFGARLAVTRPALKILHDAGVLRVVLPDAELRTRAIVVATGARYRKLELPNLARFEGLGIYYAATAIESQRCGGEPVIVVGGANSAGQAATFLARSCRQVHMLVRGPDLSATMSRYLIRRIEETPNITVHRRTQIVGLDGNDHLEQVTWRDPEGTRKMPIRHVFSMTGAVPNTDWLRGTLALDAKGFVCTGADLDHGMLEGWPLERRPYLFETSVPRVFAVGDARANSVKRVASAVGEGSVCIQLVHRVLSE